MNRNLAAIGFLSFYAIISAIYLAKVSNEFQGILFLIPPLLATILGFYAAKTYEFRNVHGRSMLFMALGLGFFFIGELIFFLFQYVFNMDPFPSVADVFYLTAYPLLLFGFITEIRIYKPRLSDFNTSFLSVALPIIALVGALVVYFGIIKVFDQDASFWSNWIAMSYGVADLILLIPSVFILKLALGFSGGKLFNSWMMIFYAVLFMLAGDLLFALNSDNYSTGAYPYTLIDLLWTASYLLFGFSFFYTASVLKELRQVLNQLRDKIKIKSKPASEK